MRRFSQRSHLVTLNEINITPLLDLAFVLLIIFIITTPLLEKGLSVKLPGGGQADKPVQKQDIRTVEINQQGQVFLNSKPVTIAAMEQSLVRDFKVNPNLVVYVRADRKTSFENFAAVSDACQRNGITRLSVRTEPKGTR